MRSVFEIASSPLIGRRLIEASAGTGKTYSLTHIVLRLIVEERIAIERLLLVTFTKAAAAELKMRVRDLLVRTQQALEDSENAESYCDDTLLGLIKKWREKGIDPQGLHDAIDRLDDASIFTIHSFCQRMLEENKFSSSEGFDFEIGDDADLRSEVIDEFLREHLEHIDNDELKRILIDKDPWDMILKTLTGTPEDADIALFENLLYVSNKTGKHDAKAGWMETPQQIETEEQYRKILERFIETTPALLKQKKRSAGIRSFNDLLLDMYRELGNEAFVKRVQSRYDGILIDEFQDTDPIQYAIFKRLFLMPDSKAKSVFFVGDPKQSIYRFRDADIDTYLAAQKDIGEICELKKNFRSCPTLLESINCFFTQSGEPFLDSGMSYSAIDAGGRKGPLLIKENGGFKALNTFEIWTKKESLFNPGGDRAQQVELVASEIAALLSGSVYKSETERLKPGDIAILVRNKTYVDLIKNALAKKGIRILFQDESNIFNTEEAREMLRIIEALESPRDVNALRQARATRLMGETINSIIPEGFENDSKEKVDDKAALKARELIEQAVKIWEKRGVSAAIAKIMRECRTQFRLLPIIDGERQLANYQHLIEILQEASSSLKGVSGLARWLAQQIKNPSDEDKYRLRLDSDADLVNVMTIHKSKGLEFPVVFLLFANQMEPKTPGDKYSQKRIFRETKNGRIKLTISFHKLYADVFKQLYHQEVLENLRLAYVGMTRASQRLVLPLCCYKNRQSLKINSHAYAQILTGKLKSKPQDYEDVLNHLKEVCPEGFGIRTIDDSTRTLQWHESIGYERKENQESESLSAAPGRPILTSWFPTSYTAIARGAAETTEEETLIDEKEDSEDEDYASNIPAAEDRSVKASSKLGIMDFERGLESGTFLHSLFEKIDFTVVKNASLGIPEAENNLNKILTRLMTPFQYHLQPYGVEGYLPVFNRLMKDVLCAKLVDKSVFGTTSDIRLCDLDPNRKTPEMSFTISIGTPSEGRVAVSAKNLSRLLAHFEPIYHIEIENDLVLKGYLTGAIDLTFELDGQYFVLDWKGTKLAQTPEGFTQERILEEINRHHYSLQYLIYLVALRRHLRLCGIDNPDEKIAGAIYAFIRGIRRDDEKPYGVFTARVPSSLIVCLDDFFEKGYHEGVVTAYAAASKEEGF